MASVQSNEQMMPAAAVGTENGNTRYTSVNNDQQQQPDAGIMATSAQHGSQPIISSAGDGSATVVSSANLPVVSQANVSSRQSDGQTAVYASSNPSYQYDSVPIVTSTQTGGLSTLQQPTIHSISYNGSASPAVGTGTYGTFGTGTTYGGSSPIATTDGGNTAVYSSSYQYSQQQYQTAGSATMTRSMSTATETSRVVGHEYGAERVISVSSRRDESRTHIVGERFIEHEVKVPKRIVREEVIEKVIVVPEIVRVEEVVEEIAKVRERIIEVAYPTIVEKIVERPEYEYVEKTIEVPEKVIKEKIREVEKVVVQEKLNEVIKIIPQEKIVEVPEIQIREVLVEKIVEVPEIKEEVIVKEIRVPQYVDKMVPEIVQVPVPIDINRNMPVPVEAVVNYEYRLPVIKPKYKQVYYPVYIPTFKEIPVPMEILECTGLHAQAESQLAHIGGLVGTSASLAEIEKVASHIMDVDLVRRLQHSDLHSAMVRAWEQSSSVQETTTTTVHTESPVIYQSVPQTGSSTNYGTTTTYY